MAEVSTGISITFDSGFFAEILDVTPPGASRESIQTSHHGTSDAHTFTPAKLVDWGELQVEMAFDPGEAPPVNSEAETVTITFAGGDTWTFSGFMTGYEPSAPLEERMTASATIKVSGGVTVTGG